MEDQHTIVTKKQIPLSAFDSSKLIHSEQHRNFVSHLDYYLVHTQKTTGQSKTVGRECSRQLEEESEYYIFLLC